MTNSTWVDTHPASATVFLDRARVTRSGQVTLEGGLQTVEVRNLPLSLVPDSVRVTGRGAANARLLGVSTRLEQFAETPAEAVRDLERSIEALEDRDADLAAREALLEQQSQQLHDLGLQAETYARGLALRGRTLDAQAAIYDFVADRAQKVRSAQLEIARQRRDGAREADRLRRELKALHAARPKQRYAVAVELDVEQAGPLSLDVTYVVLGASWHPLYDLRLQESGLNLTYLAEVSQNSGEAWDGVSLTLSTARPSLALVLPELEPWFLRPFMPRAMPTARGGAAKAQMAGAAPAPMMAQAIPDESAAQVEFALGIDAAEVSEAGASLTYKLPGTADVPGNGEPRKVTVAALNLKPDMTYVTAPKLEPVCYRRAEIKNDSAYSLLPGSAQLFEGDEYLGATTLPFVAPNQTFELALGADERLRVERELVARDVDKAFLIGDRRRIRFAYKIEIENMRDGPQVVVVRDQAPVSRDEQIKVKLEAMDPKPDKQTELNVLEWRLTLDRGARRQIRLEFSVEHPRAMNVIGLQ